MAPFGELLQGYRLAASLTREALAARARVSAPATSSAPAQNAGGLAFTWSVPLGNHTIKLINESSAYMMVDALQSS
jgi:hypothetical protein